MQHEEDGQLAIDVPASPSAKAALTAEDELLLYAEQMGAEAAVRQRQLAEASKVCTCNAQAKFDLAQVEAGLKKKPVPSFMHAPGCPAFVAKTKSVLKISEAEQVRRYNATELRQKIALARKEGRL